jgi:hypothetical protein
LQWKSWAFRPFDNRLIAIDEFHHVSSNPDNKLGSQLGAFIARDKVHSGGDDRFVLPWATARRCWPLRTNRRFETVTYTYYEQLNGYQWLKSLDIGYFFYTGAYVDAVAKVLDPALKTIVHIPNVNARESLKDKQREVDEIMHGLGEWKGVDPDTGFHLIAAKEGRTLKVADLVDDSDPAKRSRVLGALKDPAQKNNRDHVDVIIALGMAKEGFDWIWCEHALTIGYRSSLTEIVQIIGRATRDAKGKERSRFTNLIAEPTAEQGAVAEAVNDMLKAISASLLMEQVLAPRYEFTPKNAGSQEGFDYGDDGYKEAAQHGGEQGHRPDSLGDQRPGQAAEPRGHAHLQGRPERGGHQLSARQDRAGARPVRQGKHLARRADPAAHGQDRARALPGAERCRPGSHSATRHCRHEHHPAGQAGAGRGRCQRAGEGARHRATRPCSMGCASSSTCATWTSI